MSKNEDYLDDLLNSVSGRNDREDITQLLDTVRENEERAIRDRESKKRRRDFGTQMYHEFDQELRADSDDDDFIRSFELELDAEAADKQMEDIPVNEEGQLLDSLWGEEERQENIPADEETYQDDISEEEKSQLLDGLLGEDAPAEEFTAGEPQIDDMLQSVDGIMDGVKQRVEDTGKEMSDEDLLESFGLTEEASIDAAPLEEAGPQLSEDLFFGDETSFGDESAAEEEQIQDEAALAQEMESSSDDGLLDLLSGLTEDSELTDIEALLKADENGEEIESGGQSEDLEMLESIKELADINPKKKKKEKKKGAFSKFLNALFGDDDDEPSNKKVAEEGSLESLTDENLEILRELDSTEKGETKKAKKEKKKKKEKKEKAPKPPKPKKEKKPKPPKEKKPKEPDLSPPLPKKPVILITVMAASILLLIMLGGNFVGYSGGVSEAKEKYRNGDYVAAYSAIAGLDVKEKDEELYQQCAIMAMIQEQYDSYVALMDAGQYAMALDSLIRGIGRYDKFYERAEEYGILMEYGKMESQIEQMLESQFSVTPEQARELYGLRRREEYSIGLRQVLENLGLE